MESFLLNRCYGNIVVESLLWNHCHGIIAVESLLWNPSAKLACRISYYREDESYRVARGAGSRLAFSKLSVDMKLI